MGLLSFGTVVRYIPHDAKYIYVFTELGHRLIKTDLGMAAPAILKALYDDISRLFPRATVIIKRGGDEIRTWAQFAFANITLCSPSTYCFWPAMASTKTVYMPATTYIAGPEKNKSGLFIHRNFHWIYDANLFYNISKKTKAFEIIRILRSDLPRR